MSQPEEAAAARLRRAWYEMSGSRTGFDDLRATEEGMVALSPQLAERVAALMEYTTRKMRENKK